MARLLEMSTFVSLVSCEGCAGFVTGFEDLVRYLNEV